MLPDPFEQRLDELRNAAIAAAANAWAPYSHFHVGAALLTRSGRVFPGCNVENATYGATCCAERVAIGNAIAAGERDFIGIAIFTDTPKPVSPCGICRQVIAEFGPHLAVASFCSGDGVLRTTAGDLLPHGFTADDFAHTREGQG